MRLSKTSIKKLKKYVDFLHRYNCDIIIHHSSNKTDFLVDLDSVPYNNADLIEVHDYFKCITIKEFKSINSFLRHYSSSYKHFLNCIAYERSY